MFENAGFSIRSIGWGGWGKTRLVKSDIDSKKKERTTSHRAAYLLKATHVLDNVVALCRRLTSQQRNYQQREK